MVGRENAVTVGEEKVRRAAGPDAGVPAQRYTETVVRVANPFEREVGVACERMHNVLRFVRRAIVRDDDLKFACHIPLHRQRHQRSHQVRRTFVRRENH